MADPGERCSTIQRLGSTTKRCSSLRWTIVSFQVPVLAMAAAVFCPWYPASAKINLMRSGVCAD